MNWLLLPATRTVSHWWVSAVTTGDGSADLGDVYQKAVFPYHAARQGHNLWRQGRGPLGAPPGGGSVTYHPGAAFPRPKETRAEIFEPKSAGHGFHGERGGDPPVHAYFFGFHSRASRCASAIWAGVIYAAKISRFLTALSRVVPGGKREAARLDHIWACT